MPALRRQRQEDLEFKASLSYRKRHCLKWPRVGNIIQWQRTCLSKYKAMGSIPSTKKRKLLVGGHITHYFRPNVILQLYYSLCLILFVCVCVVLGFELKAYILTQSTSSRFVIFFFS
jgi:hypothetical protein